MRSRACLRFWRVCRATAALCVSACLSYSVAAWSALSACLEEIARISRCEFEMIRSASNIRASSISLKCSVFLGAGILMTSKRHWIIILRNIRWQLLVGAAWGLPHRLQLIARIDKRFLMERRSEIGGGL